MDRRKALKQFSLIVGGIVASPIASGFLAGCKAAGDKSSWQPKILTPFQNDVLTIIAEHIIPQTDTPGAQMARVNTFIDIIIADWFSEEEKNAFFQGMKDALAFCSNKYNRDFLECSAEEQKALLVELDNEFHNSEGKVSPPAEFLNIMKQFTLIGYYTSEIGATQELNIPVMGLYSGCELFDDTSRAWAW